VKISNVGALWVHYKEDKRTGNQTAYMTGYIDAGIFGKIRIAVFENQFKTYKEDDRKPDYTIVLSEQQDAVLADHMGELPDNPECPF
jgi:hypothetical protein